MTIFYTKCGRKFHKSTKAEITGFHITEKPTGDIKSGQIADPQCAKCPFVVDIKEGWPGVHKRFECRAGSHPPNYQNTYHGNLEDKCTLHIRSLDHNFCEAVISYCQDHENLSAGYNLDCSDCRRTVSVSCSQNKRGIGAKKELVAKFFPLKAEKEGKADMGKLNIDNIRKSASQTAQTAATLDQVPALQDVRCDLIDFNPQNIFADGDTEEEIRDLADDIAANGLLHPVTLNHVGGRYRLISGDRRLRAVRLLDWRTIPATVFEALDEYDELCRLWAANLQTRKYTTQELISHYLKLVDLYQNRLGGSTLTALMKDRIAKVLNISRRQVNKYVRLWDELTKEEQGELIAGRMSINKANEISKQRAMERREPVPDSTKPAAGREPAPDSTKLAAGREPIPDSPKPVAGRELAPDSPKSVVSREPVPDSLKPAAGRKLVPDSAKPAVGREPVPDSAKPAVGREPVPDSAKPAADRGPVPDSTKPAADREPAPHFENELSKIQGDFLQSVRDLELTEDERRTVDWLKDCEWRTLVNLTSIIQKATGKAKRS